MPAVDRIIDALRDRDCHPKQSGGNWSAKCPAHDDQNPSLSIRGIEGHTLLFCHAGCDTGDIMAALDLTMSDLFDEPRGATYLYNDGRIVHRTPEKKFWQTGTTTGTATLYRLDRVVEAVAAKKTIYIAEGEKDVHSLESIGLVATTAPMGAGKWSKVDPTPLANATVTIIADADDPGRRHATEVKENLQHIGANVTIVTAKVGKDASDHVAAGYGPDDIIPLLTISPHLEIIAT